MKHTLTYRIEKIPEGYLAQCIEIPQIVAHAKTRPKLEKMFGAIVDGYLRAVPDALKGLNRTVGYATYEIKHGA